MKLMIDTHLDLAWNALSWKRDITLPLAEINRKEAGQTDVPYRGNATVSLPELRRGGLAVVLGTLMGRVPYQVGYQALAASTLDHPSHAAAFGFAQGQLAYYRQLEREGQLRLIRSADGFNAHWQQWERSTDAERLELPVGVIVAMEGADSIVNPEQVGLWFDEGLRCASLVHYGRSAYAVGTGDDGPLTPAGRRMLAEFDRVGMILDVTHLSDLSFFEALDHFGGPLLASHSNCRALVPDARQFTDEQMRRIIARSGVVGVACDAWMLVPGYVRGETKREVVRIEALADHIDHICQLAGNTQHVAIGSDLDGGFGTEQTPVGLDSIRDLQKLDAILAGRGYTDEQIAMIFHGNWSAFFRQHLPATDRT